MMLMSIVGLTLDDVAKVGDDVNEQSDANPEVDVDSIDICAVIMLIM